MKNVLTTPKIRRIVNTDRGVFAIDEDGRLFIRRLDGYWYHEKNFTYSEIDLTKRLASFGVFGVGLFLTLLKLTRSKGDQM